MTTPIRRIHTVVLVSLLCAAMSLVARAQAPGASMTPTSFKVQVVGQGRPMILIPGLMSSGDTWKSTVARYQDRFRCHVLTLAGFAGVPPIKDPLPASPL